MDIVKRAELFAEDKHKGKRRRYTLEPYIEHCKRMANCLKDMEVNENMICAAYLHDVLEDCDCSFSEIVFDFGKDIARLVLELTNPTHFGAKKMWCRSDRLEYERTKLSTASIEAKVIKCFDIQDNLLSIIKHDSDLANKYIKESELLVDAMIKPILLPYHISLFYLASRGLEKYFKVF